MKELEKTKRISIASILFIIAIIAGVLTYERPKNTYANNTKNTLTFLEKGDYLLNLDNIDFSNSLLIDIRSPYEYDKGHIGSAINIPVSEILSTEHQSTLKSSNKTIVLYGKTVQQANIPFAILYQLGFENIKLLNVRLNYSQNKLITQNTTIEKPIADIDLFIKKSNDGSDVKTTRKKPIAKKAIILKKKKKKVAEGGC